MYAQRKGGIVLLKPYWLVLEAGGVSAVRVRTLYIFSQVCHKTKVEENGLFRQPKLPIPISPLQLKAQCQCQGSCWCFESTFSNSFVQIDFFFCFFFVTLFVVLWFIVIYKIYLCHISFKKYIRTLVLGGRRWKIKACVHVQGKEGSNLIWAYVLYGWPQKQPQYSRLWRDLLKNYGNTRNSSIWKSTKSDVQWRSKTYKSIKIEREGTSGRKIHLKTQRYWIN